MGSWGKRLVIVLMLLINVGCYAAESPDNHVLKLQMVESHTLTKNDINALSMGRNDDGKYGVEIWLTQRFAEALDKIVKTNHGKELQLRLNGKVIRAAVIQSPLGCRFEIANLSRVQANDIIKELSKDYSIDING